MRREHVEDERRLPSVWAVVDRDGLLIGGHLTDDPPAGPPRKCIGDHASAIPAAIRNRGERQADREQSV